MRRCEVGSGFWCGNQTAVCVYGQMRCDQADDCFDGGTDEIGCPPVRNYTYGLSQIQYNLIFVRNIMEMLASICNERLFNKETTRNNGYCLTLSFNHNNEYSD
ncbi:unnamed protein product [Schistosoma curassoni]|uniref:LNR domain-containing protein n=1 Tax=Schistosoma curassoni TaxID=6186 RepID=A0A183KMP8_9TREM|nr:unnamed protein product [Schistosoma curassoni]